MIINQDVQTVLNEVGHDGSEIVWSDKPDPYCRRSFHVQEMVPLMINNHCYPVRIEANPLLHNDANNSYQCLRLAINNLQFGFTEKKLENAVNAMKLFEAHMLPMSGEDNIDRYKLRFDGVLIGLGSRGGAHAAAWNSAEQLVYDPCGEIYTIDKFNIWEFWFAARINNHGS